MYFRKHWYQYTVVGIAMVGLFFMASGYLDCKDQGGKYVRGFFWMECLEKSND